MKHQERTGKDKLGATPTGAKPQSVPLLHFFAGTLSMKTGLPLRRRPRQGASRSCGEGSGETPRARAFDVGLRALFQTVTRSKEKELNPAKRVRDTLITSALPVKCKTVSNHAVTILCSVDSRRASRRSLLRGSRPGGRFRSNTASRLSAWP